MKCDLPRSNFFRVVLLVIVALMTGCASTPSEQAPDADGGANAHARARLVAIANELIGAPYRFGGASPHGFDCSGFVHYTHRKVGVVVPRTARSQFERAQRIEVSKLAPGDLVFFELSGSKVSHVGVYVGKKRFVHAPSTGKSVSSSSIDSPYWRARLVGAGRFL